MVAGLGLAILEVILPGYIFVGFAVAAVATGALIWLGVLGGSLPVTLVVFAVVSVAAWAGLRAAVRQEPRRSEEVGPGHQRIGRVPVGERFGGSGVGSAIIPERKAHVRLSQ